MSDKCKECGNAYANQLQLIQHFCQPIDPEPTTYQLVLRFFKDDQEKTEKWFNTPNPNFGNIRPCVMSIERPVKLHKMVEIMLEENTAPESEPTTDCSKCRSKVLAPIFFDKRPWCSMCFPIHEAAKRINQLVEKVVEKDLRIIELEEDNDDLSHWRQEAKSREVDVENLTAQLKKSNEFSIIRDGVLDTVTKDWMIEGLQGAHDEIKDQLKQAAEAFRDIQGVLEHESSSSIGRLRDRAYFIKRSKEALAAIEKGGKKK